MKENNSSNNNQNNKSVHNNNNSINNHSHKKQLNSLNQYINHSLDSSGFSRYSLLLFVTNALFLFCEGMNEIIHIILLSMIDEKHNLSHYHLAFMNSIEYLGYSISTLLVTPITNYIKRKNVILICIFLSLLCTGLSITSFNFYFASFNRFILGFCFGILNLLIYLNLFEDLPTKIRGFVSTMILLFFPLGEFMLSLVCYFKLKEGEMEVNYKFMILIPFIFICIICLAAIFLQESPRDLFFGKHLYSQGVESFRKISQFNRDNESKNKFNFGEADIDNIINNRNIELRNINPNIDNENNNNNLNNNIDNIENIFDNNEFNGLIMNNSNSKTSKLNRFKLLFNSYYCKFTILFWLVGSFSGFVFSGIHFMLPATAPKISKQTFLDLVLFESMEIPPNFFAMLLIENKGLGRIQTIRFGFIISFFISLTNIYLGETILLFDCLQKFSLAIPLNVLMVYCSEIYGSQVRTLGLSLMNFWRKVMSLLSPFFMSYILYNYGEFHSHLCYTPLLFFCAFGSLFFDIETRGKVLDENIQIG